MPKNGHSHHRAVLGRLFLTWSFRVLHFGPWELLSYTLKNKYKTNLTTRTFQSEILFRIRIQRAKDFGDLPPRSGIQWGVDCGLNVPIIVTPIRSVGHVEYLVIMLLDKAAQYNEWNGQVKSRKRSNRRLHTYNL